MQELTGRGAMRSPGAPGDSADAQAYAAWLGRTLPTEAQWEYAAKADGRAERIDRGPRDAQGRPRANFWQGIFPYLDSAEHGHIGRAPVGCYEANGLGLQDLIGNVWEWTSDPWSGGHQQHGTGMATAAGGRAELGLIKGGSFLCSTDSCVRYRASARHPQEFDVPASHIGFRTVVARQGQRGLLQVGQVCPSLSHLFLARLTGTRTSNVCSEASSLDQVGKRPMVWSMGSRVDTRPVLDELLMAS
jgi:hypothetical protein